MTLQKCNLCTPNLRLYRYFSTTQVRWKTHYEALGVPNTASKMEIKSKFYRLSKLYHPDTTKDPNAKDKFHRVSEAYAVLSDDSQRRAYDRKVVESTYPRPMSTAYEAGRWEYELYGTRQRGATHAWEHLRRYRQQYEHQHRPPGTSQSQSHRARYNPATGRTGGRRPGTGGGRIDKEEEERRAHDKLVEDSALGRFLRVFGVVLVVTWVGGGLSASAT